MEASILSPGVRVTWSKVLLLTHDISLSFSFPHLGEDGGQMPGQEQVWNLSIAKVKLAPLSIEGSQVCAPIMKGEEAGSQKHRQQRRTGTQKGTRV